MSYRIAEETSGGGAERVKEEVFAALLRYNAGRAGPLGFANFTLSVREDDDALLGGLVAMQYWNAMQIELLWVREDLRGRGIGTELMNRAEAVLRNRNGEMIFLSTWSFQAPAFYEKLGYSSFGTLQGVPPGGSRIWYCKRLL